MGAIMYRNVIQVSKEVSGDKLKSLADVAEQEFNNRAGRVRNVSPNPYQFIFEGNEKEY
jgi:hypothetical protein